MAYDELLLDSDVTTPIALSHNRHVYHVYAVRTDDRDGLKQKLVDAGIGCGVHYPIPVHLQKAYTSLGYPEGSLPNAEAAANEVLSLPIYPELPEEGIRETVNAIGKK